MKETWKDIEGFEGLYSISNTGKIKSFRGKKHGRILLNRNKYGDYLRVVLKKGDMNKTVLIHRVVASHFICEIPKGHHVHHKDGDKQNNYVTNLEIISPRAHSLITKKENPTMFDGMILHNKLKRSIPVIQLDANMNIVSRYKNSVEAGIATGICIRNIHQVASKTEYKRGLIRKQAGGYKWIFEKDIK